MARRASLVVNSDTDTIPARALLLCVLVCTHTRFFVLCVLAPTRTFYARMTTVKMVSGDEFEEGKSIGA